MALSGDNRGAANFCGAPNEVKLLIADKLPIPDINALACTSSESSDLLKIYMYRRAMVELPKSGTTFFLAAVRRGCLAAASLFIELGVDVNMRAFGKVWVDMLWRDACDYESFDIKNNDASSPYKSGHTAILVAIRRVTDCEPMVRLLLDAGADMSASCAQYPSALHKAVTVEATPVTKLLMDRGADPYIADRSGQTLLHIAAIRGPPALVRSLLESGLDIRSGSRSGFTALHFAVMLGEVDTVETLLKWIANDEGTEPDASTPRLIDRQAIINATVWGFGNTLYMAISRCSDEIVGLLLHHGADVNAVGGPEGNALRVAVRRYIEAKNKNGTKYGSVRQAAVARQYFAIVRRLIDNGADIGANGGENRTILQEALESGKQGLVRLLENSKARQ